MSRIYAARRLLELGALTRGEFRNITGWKPSTVSAVLSRLLLGGVIKQEIGEGGLDLYVIK